MTFTELLRESDNQPLINIPKLGGGGAYRRHKTIFLEIVSSILFSVKLPLFVPFFPNVFGNFSSLIYFIFSYPNSCFTDYERQIVH